MGVGHDGMQLFDTSGYMNLQQIKVINNLLSSGFATIPDDMKLEDVYKYKFEHLRCDNSESFDMVPVKIELRNMINDVLLTQ